MDAMCSYVYNSLSVGTCECAGWCGWGRCVCVLCVCNVCVFLSSSPTKNCDTSLTQHFPTLHFSHSTCVLSSQTNAHVPSYAACLWHGIAHWFNRAVQPATLATPAA
jgi:hypothetical protein